MLKIKVSFPCAEAGGVTSQDPSSEHAQFPRTPDFDEYICTQTSSKVQSKTSKNILTSTTFYPTSFHIYN